MTYCWVLVVPSKSHCSPGKLAIPGEFDPHTHWNPQKSNFWSNNATIKTERIFEARSTPFSKMLNACLFIYLPLVKRSGEKSPLWSPLLSNLFQKFCNTDQAYYVPLTGFRINMSNILPVLLQEARKGAHFQADSQRSKAICYTWYFLTRRKKRIRPGTTGFLFTSAKDSSVFRNTREGLMRCCPKRSDMFSPFMYRICKGKHWKI